MLYLSTKLNNIALLSIRTAGRIGTVLEPIINPDNLHIDAFYCKTSRGKTVLLDMFIRDISTRGIIIDDHSNLSDTDDLVRLQPIIKLKFKLEGKPVLSGKRRIGKVVEYAFDKDSLFIQKLYLQPPLWQSINQERLLIDRQCIIEVTDSYIVVSGPEVKTAAKSKIQKPLLRPECIS